MGMPFLFKLKQPNNHISGGGYFVAYSRLPMHLAWEIFGEKNGASSFENFRNLTDPLSKDRGSQREIGCNVLANAFFLEPQQWIADPPGWAKSIVRGKMYDSNEQDGSYIWTAIQSRIPSSDPQSVRPQGAREDREKYGAPMLVQPRLGQSSFRILVTEAYKRKCAMTGKSTLVALEAAHIVPYSGEGSHEVRNGLLLRADFHRLFDVGLVGITQDLKIKVSPRIREAWFNGKAYYRLTDQPLPVLPDSPLDRPDPDRLTWHLKNCFQA